MCTLEVTHEARKQDEKGFMDIPKCCMPKGGIIIEINDVKWTFEKKILRIIKTFSVGLNVKSFEDKNFTERLEQK